MEIPDDIVCLLTRRRFVEHFWKELRKMRADKPTTSRREAFDALETRYEDYFGSEMFPSYNAFRHSSEFLSRD